MRRALLTIFIAAACAAFLLSACTKDDTAAYEGHWTCVTIDAGDAGKISVDDFAATNIAGDDLMCLDLKDSGKAVFTVGDYTRSSLAPGSANAIDKFTSVVFTWEPVETGVNLAYGEEELALAFDEKSGYLTLDLDGMKVTFEKVDEPEAVDAGPEGDG